MSKKRYGFSFDVLDSSNELNDEDKSLLAKARKVTENAYAGYSNFHVGAVARLANGKTVSGTNQENASSPAGICAERVLLSTAATMFKDVAIETMAISYHNHNANTKSDHPISPCGICRQTLAEYEERTKTPIRLILSGLEGKVFVIEKASDLLPLSFGGEDMK